MTNHDEHLQNEKKNKSFFFKLPKKNYDQHKSQKIMRVINEISAN